MNDAQRFALMFLRGGRIGQRLKSDIEIDGRRIFMRRGDLDTLADDCLIEAIGRPRLGQYRLTALGEQIASHATERMFTNGGADGRAEPSGNHS